MLRDWFEATVVCSCMPDEPTCRLDRQTCFNNACWPAQVHVTYKQASVWCQPASFCAMYVSYHQVVTKAGTPVPKSAAVRINAEDPKYVCRAGFKLEKALDHFGIDVTGVTALDSGLSTGGFTHCMLQRGARHVSAQDCDCLALGACSS